MAKLEIGDLVSRKSYGMDILFKVVAIDNIDGEDIVTLKGVEQRLLADAPESDLIIKQNEKQDVGKSWIKKLLHC